MNQMYINHLEADKKSKNTIIAYVKDIKQCLEYIGKNEEDITDIDLANWKDSLCNYASSSINSKKVAVKKYFEFLYERKIIQTNPATQLKSIKVKNKEKTAITPSQIRDMLNATTNVRSQAIISLLASTGMRISEMLSLTVEQIKQSSVIITGKGDKDREIFIREDVRELIEKYLRFRGESEYSNVFISNGGHPMQPNNVSAMLKNTARKAGIANWKEISNHWLRVAAATMQSEAGQPIELIQEMLGHEDINTTKRYVKITRKRLESAMTAPLF